MAIKGRNSSKAAMAQKSSYGSKGSDSSKGGESPKRQLKKSRKGARKRAKQIEALSLRKLYKYAKQKAEMNKYPKQRL